MKADPNTEEKAQSFWPLVIAVIAMLVLTPLCLRLFEQKAQKCPKCGGPRTTLNIETSGMSWVDSCDKKKEEGRSP
jgi:hypothetical protein